MLRCPINNLPCNSTGCSFRGGHNEQCHLKNVINGPMEIRDRSDIPIIVNAKEPNEDQKLVHEIYGAHDTAGEGINKLFDRLSLLKDENERLSAEIEELKEFVRDVDRSLYHGPDLSDPEIMQHYISVFEIIKKDAKDLLNELSVAVSYRVGSNAEDDHLPEGVS